MSAAISCPPAGATARGAAPSLVSAPRTPPSPALSACCAAGPGAPPSSMTMATRRSPSAWASAVAQASSPAPEASLRIRSVRLRSLVLTALTSTIRFE